MLYNLSKKSCLELCSPYQTDPIGSPKATINYKSARYDYNVYIIIIIYKWTRDARLRQQLSLWYTRAYFCTLSHILCTFCFLARVCDTEGLKKKKKKVRKGRAQRGHSLFLESEEAASLCLGLSGRGQRVRPRRAGHGGALGGLVQHRHPFVHLGVVFGLEQEVRSALRPGGIK